MAERKKTDPDKAEEQEAPKVSLNKRFATARFDGDRWLDASGVAFTTPETRLLHQFQDAEKAKARAKALGGG